MGCCWAGLALLSGSLVARSQTTRDHLPRTPDISPRHRRRERHATRGSWVAQPRTKSLATLTGRYLAPPASHRAGTWIVRVRATGGNCAGKLPPVAHSRAATPLPWATRTVTTPSCQPRTSRMGTAGAVTGHSGKRPPSPGTATHPTPRNRPSTTPRSPPPRPEHPDQPPKD